MGKGFVAFVLSASLVAQSAQATDGAIDLSVSPFGEVSVSNDEASALRMPPLTFTPTPEDAGNYDKYYYFHRPKTDFATAFADISECDGYARGLSSTFSGGEVPYPYAGTLAGAAGGLIANAMIAAIFVPAEKRRMRRVNMRQCMGFKGYSRHGLNKDLWQVFNFEEGTGAEKEESRIKALKLQALVASTASPDGEGLAR
jgi:hypothetical protein